MEPGLLRHTITIERVVGKTKTPTGNVVPLWGPFATVRAEIVKRSASDLLAGFGEVEAGTVIFRVRQLDGLTTADRIIHNGVAYDLKDFAEFEPRWLELRAVATS